MNLLVADIVNPDDCDCLIVDDWANDDCVNVDGFDLAYIVYWIRANNIRIVI